MVNKFIAFFKIALEDIQDRRDYDRFVQGYIMPNQITMYLFIYLFIPYIHPYAVIS